MKTVSLELAKQLKKNGYIQDTSHFWYVIESDGKTVYLWEKSTIIEKSGRIILDAPTADEILDILPNELIGDEGMRFDLNIYKGKANVWVVCYWWDEDSRRKSGIFIKNVVDKSLADAAAKAWLFLKKENLLASNNE